MNSVERIQEYIQTVPSEAYVPRDPTISTNEIHPSLTEDISFHQLLFSVFSNHSLGSVDSVGNDYDDDDVPKESSKPWPSHGRMIFEHISLSYKTSPAPVLKYVLYQHINIYSLWSTNCKYLFSLQQYFFHDRSRKQSRCGRKNRCGEIFTDCCSIQVKRYLLLSMVSLSMGCIYDIFLFLEWWNQAKVVLLLMVKIFCSYHCNISDNISRSCPKNLPYLLEAYDSTWIHSNNIPMKRFGGHWNAYD